MEAGLRTAVETLTGEELPARLHETAATAGIKRSHHNRHDVEDRVVARPGNAKEPLEKVKLARLTTTLSRSWMSGGCVGGGVTAPAAWLRAQPRISDTLRAKVLYDSDVANPIRSPTRIPPSRSRHATYLASLEARRCTTCFTPPT